MWILFSIHRCTQSPQEEEAIVELLLKEARDVIGSTKLDIRRKTLLVEEFFYRDPEASA